MNISFASKFAKKKTEQLPKPAKENKFKKLLHLIFVHNLGYKLLALGLSVLCWLLAVCLG